MSDAFDSNSLQVVNNEISKRLVCTKVAMNSTSTSVIYNCFTIQHGDFLH